MMMRFPIQYQALNGMIGTLETKTSNDPGTVREIQEIAARASEIITEETPFVHNDHIRIARERTLTLLQKAIQQADLYRQDEHQAPGRPRRYHVADALTPALDALQMYTRIAFQSPDMVA